MSEAETTDAVDEPKPNVFTPRTPANGQSQVVEKSSEATGAPQGSLLHKACEALLHHYNMDQARQRAAIAIHEGLNPMPYGMPYPGNNETTTKVEQKQNGMGSLATAGMLLAALALGAWIAPWFRGTEARGADKSPPTESPITSQPPVTNMDGHDRDWVFGMVPDE